MCCLAVYPQPSISQLFLHLSLFFLQVHDNLFSLLHIIQDLLLLLFESAYQLPVSQEIALDDLQLFLQLVASDLLLLQPLFGLYQILFEVF